MQSRTSIAVSVAALLAALAAMPAWAQSAHDAHAAHSHAAQEAAPAATPTQRWATDAPLRDGIRRLREATETLNHYAMGHLDDVQRDNAVEKIDAAIESMFTNCKLEPEADAVLHGLLAKFIAGANAARAGTFTKAELVPMQDALAEYPRLFDDHDWVVRAH